MSTITFELSKKMDDDTHKKQILVRVSVSRGFRVGGKTRIFVSPKDWDDNWCGGVEHRRGKLSLSRYLELLFEAQGAEACDSEDEADIVLVMGKAEKEKEVSLTDANFFMT